MAKAKTQIVTLEIETPLTQPLIGRKAFWQAAINAAGHSAKVLQVGTMTADSSKKGKTK